MITTKTLDPVRESDYHTIFNFRDRAAESLPQLIPGSQILVEGEWLFVERAPLMIQLLSLPDPTR